MEFFLYNKRKIAVKPAMHQNSAVSKVLTGNFQNQWSYISILSPENLCIRGKHRLLGKTIKLPLSHSEP